MTSNSCPNLSNSADFDRDEAPSCEAAVVSTKPRPVIKPRPKAEPIIVEHDIYLCGIISGAMSDLRFCRCRRHFLVINQTMTRLC